MQLFTLAGFIFSLAALTAPTFARVGPCTEETQRLGTAMPGKFVPQCTETGFYQVEQCHGSTGYCWCVDPNTGKELQGSRVAPGHGQPACAHQLALLVVGSGAPTLERVGPCTEESQRLGTEMPGKFVPKCTETGFYQVEQCYGSTGYCWCVDPNTGKELQGSRVAPGHGQPACGHQLALLVIGSGSPISERTGPCAQEQQRLGTEMPGKFVPKCTEAGYYQVQQYYGSTGYSWCVDPDTGKELQGSRIAPGNGQPECPPCHKKRAAALQRPGMIGSYAPTCDEYGLFVPTQHHGSTGQSWCVDRFNGEEFENTRTHPGQKMPECSGSRYCRKNETEGRPCCAMYFRESSSVLRLDCTKNGYFKVDQVMPYNNEHFCVDPASGFPASDAVAPNCGACFKYNEDKVGDKCTYAWMSWTPMCRLGAQILACDSKTGNYQPLQKSHDGYRFCVNPLTGAVEGEKRRFDDKTALPCEH